MTVHAPSRRMILLGGLGTAGALVVGYALWPSHRAQRADAIAGKPGQHFVNNWIRIGQDDSVTIVVPHCDMGTGIFTALPQMAAEELDADWSKVRVEAAPADPLFANGALAEGFILGGRNMTTADLPAFLRGTVANTFRTIATYMDLQVTGGSSAVRATGAANGANPISIIIPCHRVIGSNGSLTGYGGGLGAKRFLLELERTRT